MEKRFSEEEVDQPSFETSQAIQLSESDLGIEFETTENIAIPKRLIDQVIGQDEAVKAIKKAAIQRRNVLLIGKPGTGKSMLGQALAELLPKEELQDILCLPNPKDQHHPKIMTVPAGEGRRIVEHYQIQARKSESVRSFLAIGIPLMILLITFIYAREDILMGIFVAIITFFIFSQMRSRREMLVPKLIVDKGETRHAPFNDATGAHAGALLGDVRHDPFQSGGLGTPAHERVESGLIHKSHKGVLFVDEIGTLKPKTQVALLSAMQDKKFPITGQSELSSGAMVRTDLVPCDFVLVAAGNAETIGSMHPALRSRIRGYGYEVFVHHTMPDTLANRRKLVTFAAQEITKDGKIPHFEKIAVEEIIKESRRRAGRKKHLSLMLRDLGGLIRAAGDIAREENMRYVKIEHVIRAKRLAWTLERQMSEREAERRKEYKMILVQGAEIGRVNGLAVIGEDTGIVLPIESEVVSAISRGEGKIVATGRLRVIAKEAIQNVSAIIKKHIGTDISNYDIHVQFIGTYEGIEGDSASISAATAVISALEGVPVKQDTALTGSITVRGIVLPVGGITAKVTAAAEAGIKRVIIPHANLGDAMLSKSLKGQIEIIPVKTIAEVLANALYLEDTTLLEKFKGFPELTQEDEATEKSKISDLIFRKKPRPTL
ncbi:MAG: ATP-dependent protease LonB [Candidatus Heimdallarchaeota archaeon]